MIDDDIDSQGIGCLVIAGIVSIVAAVLLAGCASMPGPPVATPALVAQGYTPNCIMWCKITITTADAKSDVQSDGSAPVTLGDQTIDLDSTVKTSKAVSVDPKP